MTNLMESMPALAAFTVVLTGIGGLVTLLVNRVVGDKTEKLWQRINGNYVSAKLCIAYRETQAAQAASTAKELSSQEARMATTLAAQTAATAAALASTHAAASAATSTLMMERHYLDNRARIEALEKQLPA